MEDLKTLHDQALGAAGQARKAVENNAMMLQQKLAERTKLLSQLEQAKMQETVAKSLESMSSLAAPGNTPSLDEVRDKIERRYANAMGRAELASNSVEGRMLEVQKSTLDMAGSVAARADPGQHGRREAGRRVRAPGGGQRRGGRSAAGQWRQGGRSPEKMIVNTTAAAAADSCSIFSNSASERPMRIGSTPRPFSTSAVL